MRVLMVSPECAPAVKVGGLADMVGGLSRALAARGLDVEVAIPCYDTLQPALLERRELVRDNLYVPWYDGAIPCSVWRVPCDGFSLLLFDPFSQDQFFRRGFVYGQPDDVLRFAFFCKAVLEHLLHGAPHPDILHGHDWQAALTPVLLYEMYQQAGLHDVRACSTIHNFRHQGKADAELLRAVGLGRAHYFYDPRRLQDPSGHDEINLLKGAIVYSNFVTTVSPHHAWEARFHAQGFGLEAVLAMHHEKFGGIINGLDKDEWDPASDPHLVSVYDEVAGKRPNRDALRRELDLADGDRPLVSFIGRLDAQKGLELIRHAIHWCLENDAQFVLLGTSPDPGINDQFLQLRHQLGSCEHCHLEIAFDNALAHRIYAGSDLMIVPSRFEPCGLTQLMAMRYGTVPVVRSVGGLRDTVFDWDHAAVPLEQRNGFSFEHYDTAGMDSALGRAVDLFRQQPALFRQLARQAMAYDSSWTRPAQDYENIYRHIRA